MPHRVILMQRLEGQGGPWVPGHITLQTAGGRPSYILACPGCGHLVAVPLDLCRTEGDPLNLEDLTLRGQFWHDVSFCGWQGTIAGGVAEPIEF